MTDKISSIDSKHSNSLSDQKVTDQIAKNIAKSIAAKSVVYAHLDRLQDLLKSAVLAGVSVKQLADDISINGMNITPQQLTAYLVKHKLLKKKRAQKRNSNLNQVETVKDEENL